MIIRSAFFVDEYPARVQRMFATFFQQIQKRLRQRDSSAFMTLQCEADIWLAAKVQVALRKVDVLPSGVGNFFVAARGPEKEFVPGELLVVHRREQSLQFLGGVRNGVFFLDDRHLIPSQRELDAELLTENTQGHHVVGYCLWFQTLRRQTILEIAKDFSVAVDLVGESHVVRKLLQKLFQVQSVRANGALPFVLLNGEKLFDGRFDGAALRVGHHIKLRNSQSHRLGEQHVTQALGSVERLVQLVAAELVPLFAIFRVPKVVGACEVRGPTPGADVYAVVSPSPGTVPVPRVDGYAH